MRIFYVECQHENLHKSGNKFVYARNACRIFFSLITLICVFLWMRSYNLQAPRKRYIFLSRRVTRERLNSLPARAVLREPDISASCILNKNSRERGRMKNAMEDFSGDRSQAGSNYDTYCRSNLSDHQTTCLIQMRARVFAALRAKGLDFYTI